MLFAIADKVKITPDATVSVPLLGYETKPVDEARCYTTNNPPPGMSPRPDDLFARILLLRNDRAPSPETVCIVAVDCAWATETNVDVRNPPDGGVKTFEPTLPVGTFSGWAAAAGVPQPDLSVHPTHTHYAPALTKAAADEVRDRIAALRTSPNWRPVTVHGGVVPSDLCVNRLLKKPASIPIDRSLIVMDFRDGDGNPVATIVNLGVHLTSITDKRLLSSDFAGIAMTRLEAGRPGVALFLQGWSGDVAPNRVFESEVAKSYREAQRIADLLVAECRTAIAGATVLPGDRLKVVSADRDFVTREEPKNFNKRVLFRAIAIGDKAVIVNISGEVFQDYGPMLTNVRNDFFMPSCGLVNGYAGYIPTKDGWRYEGSYELDTTPYTEAAEDSMRAGFAELLANL
jgi:hypothetical protein